MFSTTCAESMTFRVEVTAEAEGEADAILEWLVSHQAGNTGTHWFKALEDAIASLAKFPRRCALAPEHKPHVYRILFTIEGDSVFVLHIRHGRRQPLKH